MPERDISVALAAAISNQSPTLQLLLKLTLRDATVMGFAKFPVAVTYSGVTYRPGLNISVVQSQIGLSVDNLETGAGYKDGVITEAEVAAGIYDRARTELFLMDRSNHAAGSCIIQRGLVREIRSRDDQFSVEIASLVSLLQANVGRLVTPYCDTDVFSTACGLSENGTHPTLSKPFKWTGATVSVVNSSIIFRANDATAFPTDYFTNGKLTWLTGDNAGVLSEVKAHGLSAGVAIFTLHEPPRIAPVSVGDTFTVLFGCNKAAERCKAAGNFTNFQGYPFLPGARKSLAAK